jgi:hypothetical protein
VLSALRCLFLLSAFPISVLKSVLCPLSSVVRFSLSAFALNPPPSAVLRRTGQLPNHQPPPVRDPIVPFLLSLSGVSATFQL